MRRFLIGQGFLTASQTKPDRPKEAMEAILRVNKKARSSSIYRQLAEEVSLDHCRDPSFLKLRELLSAWFALK